MFDQEKRREELDKTYIEKLDDYGLDTFYDDIIFQEKLMIAQAKKDAVKEFAEKLKTFGFWKDDCNIVIIYATDIDRLLKEYEANGYDDNGNPIKYGLR